jgi:hypothetical protein
VHEALVPEAASVRAELYKLNIMEKGGFFKPHKDTPRGGTTCFGTLVVCLPVPFQGGALKLKHGKQVTTQSWSSNMLMPWSDKKLAAAHVPTKAGLQWAAFFGDVEHEVRGVKCLRVEGGLDLRVQKDCMQTCACLQVWESFTLGCKRPCTLTMLTNNGAAQSNKAWRHRHYLIIGTPLKGEAWCQLLVVARHDATVTFWGSCCYT